MTIYLNFSLSLKCYDPKAFRQAAIDRYIEDNPTLGHSKRELCEMFGTVKEPDLSACAQMLFDPGISPSGSEIQDSHCEEYEI